jgi:hypothetical protein
MLGSMQMIFMLVVITHDPIGELKLLPIKSPGYVFCVKNFFTFFENFLGKKQKLEFYRELTT